jgi:hypothetical protein
MAGNHYAAVVDQDRDDPAKPCDARRNPRDLICVVNTRVVDIRQQLLDWPLFNDRRLETKCGHFSRAVFTAHAGLRQPRQP